MRLLFVCFILSAFLIIPGCGGLSESEILQNDTITITDYLSENNLLDAASVTSTGMYYIINSPGDLDNRPSLNDIVTCNYKGYFPDGEVFDDGSSVSFTLGNTIEGWRQGIPLVGEEGSIQLFIPSGLAYGERGQGTIPGNQVIFFDVDLLKVN